MNNKALSSYAYTIVIISFHLQGPKTTSEPVRQAHMPLTGRSPSEAVESIRARVTLARADQADSESTLQRPRPASRVNMTFNRPNLPRGRAQASDSDSFSTQDCRELPSMLQNDGSRLPQLPDFTPQKLPENEYTLDGTLGHLGTHGGNSTNELPSDEVQTSKSRKSWTRKRSVSMSDLGALKEVQSLHALTSASLADESVSSPNASPVDSPVDLQGTKNQRFSQCISNMSFGCSPVKLVGRVTLGTVRRDRSMSPDRELMAFNRARRNTLNPKHTQSFGSISHSQRKIPDSRHTQSFPSISPSQRKIPESKHKQSCRNVHESKTACDSASSDAPRSPLASTRLQRSISDKLQQDRASAAEALGMEMADMSLDPIKATFRAGDSVRQL